VKRVLVVDDESSMREMLGIMLRREGYAVEVAESRAAAAAALARGPIDLVITDVKLPDGDGIELLRHLKAASPDTVVVVMTAYGSTEAAVAAMKLGAEDYLIKPFDVDELKIVVRNALEKHRLEEENLLLRAEVSAQHGLDRIIGNSPSMGKVYALVRSVSATGSTILLQGESGTGKELVARAIHTLSPRRDGAFVSINCAALPESLLESELFGHMKGAFTDAHQTKKGLFETAHKGTLLLDEVGEMPPTMQAKVLRVLQEKRVRRVGANDEIEVDVRVVAATNRSLGDLVREGHFREDLFYRLNVIPIVLPPLRDRREDIPLLAHHFLGKFAQEMGKRILEISPAAMDFLVRYTWPGNVRELENVMERAVALEPGSAIRPQGLPETVVGTAPVSAPATAEGSGEIPAGFDLDRHLHAIEGGLVRRALEQAQGRRVDAARILGVTPRSLRYLVRKHQAAVVGEP
jgi:two-component system response regulator PilR (NtrC family)